MAGASDFRGTGGNRAAQGTLRRNKAYGRLSKTRKLLRRLPDDLVEPIRQAMKEGAEQILDDAKSNLMVNGTVRNGNAAKYLNIKYGRDKLSVKIGVNGKRAMRKAWYLKFLESGTKAHTIKAGDGKVLIDSSGTAFGKTVQHPGHAPQPFLGPAFDANRDALNARVQALITRAINRAAGVETGGGRVDLGDAE